MGLLSGHSSGHSSGNQPPKDMVDRGVESVEKKYGGSMGQNTQRNRAANEKMTDGARGKFEDKTGMKVPHKISN